jgi:hypothetical protein
MTNRMGNRKTGFPGGNTLLITSLFFAWTLPSLADDEDPIPACAKLESDSERIACLEAAIREQSGDVAGSAPATKRAPEPEPAVQQAPPPESSPPEEDILRVTVTSVTTNMVGKLVFRTSTGQVWLQTGQRVARFDETPFEAEIRPAMMGSYFIRPSDGGISIRVRREE